MTAALGWIVGHCPQHKTHERYGPYYPGTGKLDAVERLRRAGWSELRIDYPADKAEKLSVHDGDV